MICPLILGIKLEPAALIIASVLYTVFSASLFTAIVFDIIEYTAVFTAAVVIAAAAVAITAVVELDLIFGAHFDSVTLC